jgi:hypothetical protein
MTERYTAADGRGPLLYLAPLTGHGSRRAGHRWAWAGVQGRVEAAGPVFAEIGSGPPLDRRTYYILREDIPAAFGSNEAHEVSAPDRAARAAARPVPSVRPSVTDEISTTRTPELAPPLADLSSWSA